MASVSPAKIEGALWLRFLSVGLFVLILGACEGTPSCPPQPVFPPPPVSSGFLVFFQARSVELSDQGMRTLRQIANLSKEYPSVRITGTAHADEAGNEVANYILSRRRSDAIHKVLVQLGFPADRLLVSPLGNLRPLVPGRVDPQNRRVEMNISGLGRVGPPEGYREVEMRCITRGRFVVPVTTP